MADACQLVLRHLLHPIDARSGGREGLAYPIWRDREEHPRRWGWEAVTFPAREVRNQGVLTEAQLWLDEDPPSTRAPTAPVMEWATKRRSEPQGRVTVGPRRSRRSEELSFDQLAEELFGKRFEMRSWRVPS